MRENCLLHLDPAKLPGILRRSNHLGSETVPFWGQWFAVMANLISWSWTCDVRILPKHWPFSKGRCRNLNVHLLLYPLWVGQPQAQAIPNSNLQRQFPQTANGYRHVLHFLQQFISLFLHSQFLWKVKKSSFPWTTWKLLPNEMIWYTCPANFQMLGCICGSTKSSIVLYPPDMRHRPVPKSACSK